MCFSPFIIYCQQQNLHKLDKLDIGYDNKTVEEALTTNYFGLQIVNNFSWKKYIEYIIPKLSSACFVMRIVTPLLKVDTLKLVYFEYLHSIKSHGVIF
jgi:hypothetical protein